MKLTQWTKRYLVDATASMAVGLFSSLIIGLILAQVGKIPGLAFIGELSTLLGASSPVVGAVIGVAVASGLGAKPLAMFSCGGVGAIGYAAGGPVGAFIGAIIGAEAGEFVYHKTPADIIVVPFITILAGGIVGKVVGEPVSSIMTGLGQLVNHATELSPLPMGIAVAIIVGMTLTLPISSAALCIMLDLSGLAAGAAVAGCTAQMIGFALVSFRDNGVNGLMSQGIGTSMLQIPNIMAKPIIWVAPTLASAVAGAFSTSALFQISCNAMGAGMGSSGLVGQIGTLTVMVPNEGFTIVLFKILVVQFLIPAIVAIVCDRILLKRGLVKLGDMKLRVQ